MAQRATRRPVFMVAAAAAVAAPALAAPVAQASTTVPASRRQPCASQGNVSRVAGADQRRRAA